MGSVRHAVTAGGHRGCGSERPADIRGNTALQDKVQADVFLEVQRLFHDLGVLVRAVSLTWALNDVERAARFLL